MLRAPCGGEEGGCHSLTHTGNESCRVKAQHASPASLRGDRGHSRAAVQVPRGYVPLSGCTTVASTRPRRRKGESRVKTASAAASDALFLAGLSSRNRDQERWEKGFPRPTMSRPSGTSGLPIRLTHVKQTVQARVLIPMPCFDWPCSRIKKHVIRIRVTERLTTCLTAS